MQELTSMVCAVMTSSVVRTMNASTQRLLVTSMLVAGSWLFDVGAEDDDDDDCVACRLFRCRLLSNRSLSNYHSLVHVAADINGILTVR